MKRQIVCLGCFDRYVKADRAVRGRSKAGLYCDLCDGSLPRGVVAVCATSEISEGDSMWEWERNYLEGEKE